MTPRKPLPLLKDRKATDERLVLKRAKAVRDSLVPQMDRVQVAELFGRTPQRIDAIEIHALRKVIAAFEPERLEWLLRR